MPGEACVPKHHLRAGREDLAVACPAVRKGEGWGRQAGQGEEQGLLSLLSWMFLPQQVPALIAKMVPTINAVNYAPGSEMVHRRIWQCLSSQTSERIERSEPLWGTAQIQAHPCQPGLSSTPTPGGRPRNPALQPQKPSSRHTPSIPNDPVEPGQTQRTQRETRLHRRRGALEPDGPECWS